MREYVHGGDRYADTSEKIYDFSANTNPLGMPEKVREKVCESIEKSSVYPDPYCRKLVEKISEKESEAAGYKIPEEWIIPGNGAADLIFRTAHSRRWKKVLVTGPSFSEYETAFKEAGAEVIHYYLKEETGFSIEKDFLDFITEDEKAQDVDIVFLCNPNNPVGNMADKNILDRLVDILNEKNIILAVDECFLQLTGEKKERTLSGKLKDYRNIIIFRAFTKTYAMAGLRLGYVLVSDKKLGDGIFGTGQPWSVSTPAQAGGIAALMEDEYLEKSIEYIKNERKKLSGFLMEEGELLKRKNPSARSLKVYPGKANYIFFYYHRTWEFINEMRKYGILIRNCDNYPGLSAGFMRIAVRNKEENDYFIEKGKEVFDWLEE